MRQVSNVAGRFTVRTFAERKHDDIDILRRAHRCRDVDLFFLIGRRAV